MRCLTIPQAKPLSALLWLIALMSFASPQGLHAQMGAGPSSIEERVTLSVEAYRALLSATEGQRSRAAWSQPQLTVDLTDARRGGWAWVEVQATLSGGPESWVSLAPLSASPLQVWLDEQEVTPQSGAGHYEAPLMGRSALKLRYPARLERREDGSQVALIPTPLTSSAQVTLNGAPAGTELTPPLPAQPASVRLNGAIAVTLPAEGSGHLIQRQDLKVSLHSSEDGVELRSTVKVLLRGHKAWVPIAPIHEALLSAKLDGEEAVVSAQGLWLSAWVEGEGPHLLEASSRLPIDRSNGQPRVNLTLLNAPRGHLSVTLPGQRALDFSPQLPTLINTTPAQGAQGSSTLAELDLPPLSELSFGWAEKKETPEESAPQFLVDSYQLFSLQEGLLKAEAALELEVMKGELERLTVKIPEGVVLYRVEGEGVEGWATLPAQPAPSAGGASLPRRVTVNFGNPVQGRRVLKLMWQRVVKLGERFELPILTPQGAFQQSGVIALYDGERVGFTPAELRGALIPAGQEALPQRILQLKAGEKVTQAFRHVQAPGALFTSSTSERTQEVRFDAQLETLYTAREGSIRAQTQALITLKSGRVDQLTLQLPKTCSEPQVSGPSINRVEALPAAEQTVEGVTRYAVRFTRRLEGALTLNVDTELLLTGDVSESALPRLTVEGAELSRGAIGIGAELGLELSPRDQAEGVSLRKASVEELPRSIRLRSNLELLYGYRFTRPWALTVGLKRHEVVETLSARVISTKWQSELLRSGQVVHKMSYQIENQERRAARFTLPERARVRSITVNGQAARAQDEGGVISVPIPKRQESSVTLTYERALEGGPLQPTLTPPSSDLHSSQISWEVRYNEGLRLSSASGLFHLYDSSPSHVDSDDFMTRASHFSYDLLEPNSPALKLKLSLITLLPAKLIKGLKILALLMIFLAALARVMGRRFKWLNESALGLISLTLLLLLYQEGLSEGLELSWLLGESALYVSLSGVTLGGVVRLASLVISRVKELGERPVTQTSDVKPSAELRAHGEEAEHKEGEAES